MLEVYGEDFVRHCVKGCQWHFKSDVKNHINKVGPSHRERFAEICNEMCCVTTVSTFNDLLTKLKLIADIYPELQSFVKYWELRKTYVFAPFRGGSLPGMNMSESGNASFKPAATMRLVHAAKNDVSSMMLQESQIDMFQHNLIPCTGRAPTKETCDAEDRAQQLRVAEDGGSRAKKNTAITAPKITEATDAQLTVQCIKAMTIMDCEVSPESKGPTIVRATDMIHHCHGCRGDIKASDKEYPHNMVFQQHGVVGYLNRVKNEWVKSEQNIHFYLKMSCLRKNDGTIEVRYIATNDETFLWLDQQQMEWLHVQGFLKTIACKKCIM